jgi:hypothetical protein
MLPTYKDEFMIDAGVPICDSLYRVKVKLFLCLIKAPHYEDYLRA